MSKDSDDQEAARTERLNKDLSTSIDRCRSLVDECRSTLAPDRGEGAGQEENQASVPPPPAAE